MTSHASRRPRIVIVGGGLAGMAAAVALADKDVQVTLLEAKRWLGGRAGSFEDPATGETVDLCQHVAMGCCTNFIAFCEKTGIDRSFRRDTTLHFISPDGRRSDFSGSPWLPAPLHLAGSFLRLSMLSPAARWSVVNAMRVLQATKRSEGTIGQWLTAQRQPQEAIDRFWSVILVSALGETLDRASFNAARKVLVDGFLAHREAYHLLVPVVPLVDLYEQQVTAWLRQHGAEDRTQTPVARLLDDGRRMRGVELRGGETLEADYVILAVPWRSAMRMLQGTMAEPLSRAWKQIESSPITSVHLWLDSPITDLPHAILVGRLSQWLFARPDKGTDTLASSSAGNFSAYYQIVISASRDLENRSSGDILDEVLEDLRQLFPPASEARVVRSRVVTQQEAVFSMTPAFESSRPAQSTAIPGLLLAGDWTQTHWPSTMEGAVRSGNYAAESVLQALGRPAQLAAPDLPRSWLMRFM